MKPPRHRLGTLFALSALLPACAGTTAGSPARSRHPDHSAVEEPCLRAGTCVRADDWNAALGSRETGGFRFADAADTVRLPGAAGTRVLWLFGDTMLGSGAPPVNNSVAISEHARGPSVPPGGGAMRFLGSGVDAHARLVPMDITDTVPAGVRSWLPGASDLTSWLWPSSAVVVGSKLTMFHQEIGCTRHGAPWGVCPLDDMRVRRTVVAEYGGVDRPPAEWHAVPARALEDDSRSPPSNPAAEPLRLAWGLASAHEAPWVYVLGIRHVAEGVTAPGGESLAGAPSTVHLARAHAWEVGRYATWEFLDTRGAWVRGPLTEAATLRTLFGAESPGDDAGPPECSLEHVSWRGEDRWVVVHGHALVNDRIVIRLAESLESNELANVAYEYRAGAADPAAVTGDGALWAMKGHADLARIDEAVGEYWLLVSYWSAVMETLRFQWFPLHRLRPWCVATGHECLG